jgi:hypothetical protein
MLLAPIPFEYAVLIDRGDRVRRTSKRRTDTRDRPTPPKQTQD